MNLDLNSVADPGVVLPRQTAQPQAAQTQTLAAGSTQAAAGAAASGAHAAAAAPATFVAELVAMPAAATLSQLKAACPGATPEFLLQQIEAGASIDTARSAWTAKLASDLAAARSEIGQMKAAGTASGSAAGNNSAPGADPIPAGAGSSKSSAAGASHGADDAIAQWDEALEQLMTERKFSRAKATQQLVHDRPELHQAYLVAWNQKHQSQRKSRPLAV